MSPIYDVHERHPEDCRACALHAPDKACLEHTCPDCGSITYGEKNDRGELWHICVPWARASVLNEGDFFCLSPRELETGGWLVTAPPSMVAGTLVVEANSPYAPLTASLFFQPDHKIILT